MNTPSRARSRDPRAARAAAAPRRGSRPARKRAPPAQELIELVKDGATLEEAGSRFGITRERVRQILSREGIDVQSLPGRKEAKARRRLERVRQRGPVLEAMWRKGLSYREIARALGLGGRQVRQVIHERVPREDRLRRAAQHHSDHKRMPDEWALRALKDAAEILGGTPSCRAYDRLRARGLVDGPASSLIAARFGWAAACTRAGLRPNPAATRPGFGTRVYSEEDLSAALARVTHLLGHPPSVAEYDAHRHEEEPTAVTIRHRYGGSWLRARSQLLG